MVNHISLQSCSLPREHIKLWNYAELQSFCLFQPVHIRIQFILPAKLPCTNKMVYFLKPSSQDNERSPQNNTNHHRSGTILTISSGSYSTGLYPAFHFHALNKERQPYALHLFILCSVSCCGSGPHKMCQRQFLVAFEHLSPALRNASRTGVLAIPLNLTRTFCALKGTSPRSAFSSGVPLKQIVACMPGTGEGKR